MTKKSKPCSCCGGSGSIQFEDELEDCPVCLGTETEIFDEDFDNMRIFSNDLGLDEEEDEN